MFAVEEEERAVEEEIEEDEEFEFKVVFDEEFELEVTFDEVEVVEFDVVFPEVDEPKRAVIGIPSVASEIDIESKFAKFDPSHRKIIFPQGYHDYQDGERIR